MYEIPPFCLLPEVTNYCRLCNTPTSKQIWCTDLCRRWNQILTKNMLRRGRYPREKEWDEFCLDHYGETRPMFSYVMKEHEAAKSALYAEETDPRFIPFVSKRETVYG